MKGQTMTNETNQLPSRRYTCIVCGKRKRKSKRGRGGEPVCQQCNEARIERLNNDWNQAEFEESLRQLEIEYNEECDE